MKPTLLFALSACLLGGCSNLKTTDQNNTTQKSGFASAFQKEEQPIASASAIEHSVNFHKQLRESFNNKEQFKLHEQNEQLKQKEQLKLHGQKELYRDNHKDINYYVRGLMKDLVSNLQYVNNTTPIAITSFVMLDSDFTQGNLLGNQIAESLMHEVHKFGIPVIDYKTTGYIRVTEQGDFTFSKDYLDLSADLPMRYLVGGTMLKYNSGYLINARIIGVDSKAVVATAQSYIPDQVVSAIMPAPAEEPASLGANADDLPEALLTPVVSIVQG
jgi:TolB-like protein